MATKATEFTKIRAGKKSVELEWTSRKKTASGAEEQHHHQLSCPERPRPEFMDALKAFLPFVLTILGAPESWTDSTEVSGVSLNKEEDGRAGCVITVSHKCPHGAAPVAMNTPYLKEVVDATRETSTHFFLDGMDDAITNLKAEAQLYLDGERAQGELFNAGKPEAAPKDKSRKRGTGAPTAVGDVVGDVVGSIAPDAEKAAAGT